ncbi:hypothetical protein BKA66DRAFT_465221 [Pyrenochaeta sp. MPI-SDFR-AT-0127]|nr:hypothetical protein BKA66DRAFT_465221 [Pyrenochaeta sp. MPI-SDFR-AT-0127]
MNLVDDIKCPPYTIATLYEDPESRGLLRSLKFVAYLGAPLDRAIGDDLCQYTQLTPIIGSTESGDQLSLRPADRTLWYTHDFVAENGHKMVHIYTVRDSIDLHELVFESSEDGRKSTFQIAFWNPAHKDLKRVETKELYTPIQDSDGRTRWVYCTHKDDLTKLDWLAKFHAQDIENYIQRHDVKSVVVGGEGRPTPYVIIKLKEGVLRSEQLLDDLYQSVIGGANKNNIGEILIPKETVLIAKKEKRFKRNLKHVVSSKEVEKGYMKEIEQAYLHLEQVKAAVISPNCYHGSHVT